MRHETAPAKRFRENDPSPELIAGFIESYVLASCLYYGGTYESPIDDRTFDERLGFLEYWRELWPATFCIRVMDGDLKTEAHALQFTEAEKAKAELWALLGGAWPA